MINDYSEHHNHALNFVLDYLHKFRKIDEFAKLIEHNLEKNWFEKCNTLNF